MQTVFREQDMSHLVPGGGGISFLRVQRQKVPIDSYFGLLPFPYAPRIVLCLPGKAPCTVPCIVPPHCAVSYLVVCLVAYPYCRTLWCTVCRTLRCTRCRPPCRALSCTLRRTRCRTLCRTLWGPFVAYPAVYLVPYPMVYGVSYLVSCPTVYLVLYFVAYPVAYPQDPL